MERIGEFKWKISEEDIAAAKLEVERRFQDQFNDAPDCSQIPQFVPIKLELIELFKYWYTEDIKHALDACVISTSVREHYVSWLSVKRCNQIYESLSEDEIKRAMADAQETLKKSNYWLIREEDWNILFHGTAEQQAELVHRLQCAFGVAGED